MGNVAKIYLVICLLWGVSVYAQTNEVAKPDDLTKKAATLTDEFGTLKGADEHKAFIGEAKKVCTAAVEANRYDIALKLSRMMLASAKNTSDVALIKEMTAQTEQLLQLSDEYGKVKQSLAILANDPGNAAANSAVGKFYCFVKDQWETGLPMLAKGNVESLKKLAESDLADPSDSKKQLEIADGWWAIADAMSGPMKTNTMRHAAKFYVQALHDLDGLAKLRVEKKLALVKQLCPESKESLPTGGSVDLLDILLSCEWRYWDVTADNHSKVIKFGPDGAILAGKNSNESSYRIVNEENRDSHLFPIHIRIFAFHRESSRTENGGRLLASSVVSGLETACKGRRGMPESRVFRRSGSSAVKELSWLQTGCWDWPPPARFPLCCGWAAAIPRRNPFPPRAPATPRCCNTFNCRAWRNCRAPA